MEKESRLVDDSKLGYNLLYLLG